MAKTKPAKTTKKLTLPKEWAATEIVPRLVSELEPYARNARTHSKRQVQKIAASMTEFGFTNPVIVDADGTIIAGHGRVMAAKSNGYETVPTIVATGWSDAKKRAYVLADNRLAEDADWDEQLLASELLAIKETGYDLVNTGFEANELEQMLIDEIKGGSENDTPETPAKEYTVSRPDDVWLMGPHRLLVGDCTKDGNVKKLFASMVPSLLITDPPDGADCAPVWEHFAGQVAYVWHKPLGGFEISASLLKAGFEAVAQIIWRKPFFSVGRGSYHGQHEPCVHMIRKGGKSNWLGGTTQTTIWDAKPIEENSDNKKNRGSQKPVELYSKAIQNHTSEGQPCYDPFSGKGAMFAACEVTGRVALGCEINTSHADVIVMRWQKLSGKTAVLENGGLSFDEARAKRAA